MHSASLFSSNFSLETTSSRCGASLYASSNNPLPPFVRSMGMAKEGGAFQYSFKRYRSAPESSRWGFVSLYRPVIASSLYALYKKSIFSTSTTYLPSLVFPRQREQELLFLLEDIVCCPSRVKLDGQLRPLSRRRRGLSLPRLVSRP